METTKKFLKKKLPQVVFFLLLFLFSWWLMWHTFDYKNGGMLIATKVWSDFAANIPLIRSFSWGDNFPPEYPLFPGEPIKYHFLFYLVVGILEKVGLPIDWALNIPSILGFAGLVVIIYFLAKLLFKKRIVGFLTVIFFLFNGSLSFIEFFKQNPISSDIFRRIIANQIFPSFGPYDGKIVSAFGNLNIYTNQRHLAPAYFLLLLVVFLVTRPLKNKGKMTLGQFALVVGLLGILPFFHKAVLLMIIVVLTMFFFFFPKLRKSLILIALFTSFIILPQLAYQISGGGTSIFFNPGYLVSKPLILSNFFSYWILNLGLSVILIPLGVFWSNQQNKKIFLSFLTLFLIGNLFQFSPEIAANHKFFNLFLIVGNMFSAWAIYIIWRKNLLTKFAASFLIFFLTLSGIIDFFPIKNDTFRTVADAPKNPDILWIKENTPKNAIFLNSSYLYHPASLAGRKIFLGWPYFPWSAGYDTHERDRLIRKMLKPTSLPTLCQSLQKEGIDYVIIEDPQHNPDFEIDSSFFEKNFEKVYINEESKLFIFSTTYSCKKML